MLEAATLAKKLVQIKTFDPRSPLGIRFIRQLLARMGFKTSIIKTSDNNNTPIQNLYAAVGSGHPHVLFIGHINVFNTANIHGWKHPAFSGHEDNEKIYGCGINSMKGAIASFISACDKFIANNKIHGQISILICNQAYTPHKFELETLFQQLNFQKKDIDFCIIGEASNANRLGETINIGSRGNIFFEITSYGKTGHSACSYPTTNPIHNLINLLSKISTHDLDFGNEQFSSSRIHITRIESSETNPFFIPEQATAHITVHFNNNHTPEDIVRWMQKNVNFTNGQFELKYEVKNAAYYNEASKPAEFLKKEIQQITRITPTYKTSGLDGTSYYIKDYCPFVEFGLSQNPSYQINEYAHKTDIQRLQQIYYNFLCQYLNGNNIT